jgi:hypothetical protein
MISPFSVAAEVIHAQLPVPDAVSCPVHGLGLGQPGLTQIPFCALVHEMPKLDTQDGHVVDGLSTQNDC